MSIEQKTEILRSFKAQLEEGLFEKATLSQKENGLSLGDIMPTVNTLFTELIEKKKYILALDLGKQYNLDPSKMVDLISMEFGRLFATREYEVAIKWANDHHLSEGEVAKAASKLFQALLESGEIDKALDLPDKYRVRADVFLNTAQNWFNEAYQHKNFHQAAKVGQKFEVSPKRVLLAARNAMQIAMQKTEWSHVIGIQSDFDIFSDTAFDEFRTQDRTTLTAEFQKQCIEGLTIAKRYKKMEEILTSIGLLDQKFKSKELQDLSKNIFIQLSAIHNEFLDQQQIDKAVGWMSSFGLLDEYVPVNTRQKIINAAMQYHNLKLDRLDYESARNIAQTYGLFKEHRTPESYQSGSEAAYRYVNKMLEEGNIALGKKAVDDYDLPTDKIYPIARKHLINHLRRRKFDPTFEIVKLFKINVIDEDIQREARNTFNESIENKLVEVAAEIGRSFHLDKKLTQQAGFHAWERHLKNGRYDKAYKMFREYKIPLKAVHPAVKEMYEYVTQSGQADRAEKLRQQYRLELSFFEMVFLWLRKIGILR